MIFLKKLPCKNVSFGSTEVLVYPYKNAQPFLVIFLRFQKASEANSDSKQGARYCPYELIWFSGCLAQSYALLLFCLCYQSSADWAE